LVGLPFRGSQDCGWKRKVTLPAGTAIDAEVDCNAHRNVITLKRHLHKRVFQLRWHLTDRRRDSLETYIHHLPGRLRVRIDRAKNNPSTARSVDQLLRNTLGVSSVSVNVTTGSVLIHYDTSQIDADALLQRLQVRDKTIPLGHSTFPIVRRSERFPGLQPAPKRLADRVRGRIAIAAIDYVIEKAFEKAAVLLLAALL
jgi:copper chaperone CopZ